MDEHRWKFKFGSGAYDQYRAVRGQGYAYARVEVLSDELEPPVWDIFAGEAVAEEMLRLAAENTELRRCLDFHMHDAAHQKASVQALRGDLRCLRDEVIEATHDLSVKLELAEARVKELEERLALACDHSIVGPPRDLAEWPPEE